MLTFILRDMDSMKLLGIVTGFGLLLNALPFIIRSIKPIGRFAGELKPRQQTQV
jgi:hypothetical protein